MTHSIAPSGACAYTPDTSAPEWFVQNLQQPGQSRRAPLDGKTVHYLTWNWERTELPVMLMVHGFSGHARWWSYLAPFFTDRYRVASIDLPGMGDSDHRDSYDEDCFARGILAVIEENQLRDVTLVGHSYGGAQSLRAMRMAPQYFKQGVVVDTFIPLEGALKIKLIDKRGQHRRRASQQECVRDFRMMPPQPAAVPALLNYIAYHSCLGDDKGWYWKFDPDIQNYGDIWDPTLLSEVTTPVSLIYGEMSMFNDNRRPERILDLLGAPQGLIMVPKAHHHLMVDHPLELVEAINASIHKG